MKMKRLATLVTFATILWGIFPIAAVAQNSPFPPIPKYDDEIRRIPTIEVNYLGAVTNVFDRRPGSTWRSGKMNTGSGIDLAVTVPVSSHWSLGYRGQFANLTDPEYYSRDTASNPFFHTTVSKNRDAGQIDADTAYHEGFIALSIPAIKHSILFGVASETSDQQWEYLDAATPTTNGMGDERPITWRNATRTRTIGPLVGIAGNRHLWGRFGTNYSARAFPLSAKTQQFFSSTGGFGRKEPATSHGFELRGVVTFAATEHLAVNAGYDYREMITPDFYNAPTDKVGLNRGLLVGLTWTR